MAKKDEYIKFSEKKDSIIKNQMNNACIGYTYLKEHVFNYTYTFFYEDNKEIKKYILNINNNDFAHLCGIEYKNGNKNLGKDLVKKRVNWDKIWIKKDGTTLLKLNVIKSINLLFTIDTKIESGGKGLDLVYDKLIRTNRKILGIGCKQLNKENLIPLSLLNLSTSNKNNKQIKRYDVLCVIKKDKQTGKIELVDKTDTFDTSCLEIEK